VAGQPWRGDGTLMSEQIITPEVDASVAARRGPELGRLVQVRERGATPTTPTGPAVSAERRADILQRGYGRRKATNAIVIGFSIFCSILAIVPLFAIAAYVVIQGISSLDLNFFTKAQTDVTFDAFGTALPQGIGNTIVGTLLLVVIASLIGLPIGLFSGIYLAEYGRGSRFANAVRFIADVVAGLPSIVAGLVGYAVVVSTIGFSALAGGFALALLMFPVVTRSTEEVLRLVPNSLREGGLALGLPRWRIIASIVLPTASSGIITSMLLGIARVTGETAPLLFTIFGNSYWQINPLQKIGALTYTIYDYSFNQFRPEYHRLAFAGALVLVTIVVVLNVAARVIFRQRVRGRT